MNILGIIQARVGSTRLPGKVLLPILGQPSILRMIERARRAHTLTELWVATSDLPQDDALAALVNEFGCPVFRGSEQNVLDRFYQLARSRKADIVVRLTGDCPLHDPGVIDQVVAAFLAAEPPVVYASNVLPPTFPDGLDVEVFTFAALETLALGPTTSLEREHVTVGLHRAHSHQGDQPPRLNVKHSKDLSALRWTLDNEEDYKFISSIFEKLYPGNPAFGWQDVLCLLDREPALTAVNSAFLRNEKFENEVATTGTENTNTSA